MVEEAEELTIAREKARENLRMLQARHDAIVQKIDTAAAALAELRVEEDVAYPELRAAIKVLCGIDPALGAKLRAAVA